MYNILKLNYESNIKQLLNACDDKLLSTEDSIDQYIQVNLATFVSILFLNLNQNVRIKQLLSQFHNTLQHLIVPKAF